MMRRGLEEMLLSNLYSVNPQLHYIFQRKMYVIFTKLLSENSFVGFHIPLTAVYKILSVPISRGQQLYCLYSIYTDILSSL